MPIAYIGQSQAKPDQVEALRDFFTTVVAPGVTGSEGCLSYQLLQSESDPTQFIGVELWTSVEAHRASVKNIDRASIELFMQMVAGPMSGGYYKVV